MRAALLCGLVIVQNDWSCRSSKTLTFKICWISHVSRYISVPCARANLSLLDQIYLGQHCKVLTRKKWLAEKVKVVRSLLMRQQKWRTRLQLLSLVHLRWESFHLCTLLCTLIRPVRLLASNDDQCSPQTLFSCEPKCRQRDRLSSHSLCLRLTKGRD